MPSLNRKVCAAPACMEIARGGKYCNDHAGMTSRFDRERRGSAHDQGYDWTWRRAAKRYLSKPENRWCRMCVEEGRGPMARLAEVVDHRMPVRLGGAMWDKSNWQPLCKQHHSGAKQRMDNKLRRQIT